MSAWNANVEGHVTESVAVALPRICVRPTNPSKSVICDGSLMLATARRLAGLSGLWWTTTPKGLKGVTPPGIGFANAQAACSEACSPPSSAKALFERKRPAPTTALAPTRMRLRRLSPFSLGSFQTIESSRFIVILLQRADPRGKCTGQCPLVWDPRNPSQELASNTLTKCISPHPT